MQTGLAKPSLDADLASQNARVTELERDVALLRRVLATAHKSAVEAAAAARQQAVSVLMKLAKATAPQDEIMPTQYTHYERVHAFLDVELPPKISTAFNKVVLEPLDAWAAEITATHADVADADVKRRSFDHYRVKVESLATKRRDLQMKGKVVSKSDEERGVRNDEKLATAAAAYGAARDRAVGRLAVVLADAPAHLDSLLLRIMQYEGQLFKEGSACVRAFEPFINELRAASTARAAAAGDTAVRVERAVRAAHEARVAGGDGASGGPTPSAAATAAVAVVIAPTPTADNPFSGTTTAHVAVVPSAPVAIAPAKPAAPAVAVAGAGNPFPAPAPTATASAGNPFPAPAPTAAAGNPFGSGPASAAAPSAAVGGTSRGGAAVVVASSGSGNPFGARSAPPLTAALPDSPADEPLEDRGGPDDGGGHPSAAIATLRSRFRGLFGGGHHDTAAKAAATAATLDDPNDGSSSANIASDDPTPSSASSFAHPVPAAVAAAPRPAPGADAFATWPAVAPAAAPNADVSGGASGNAGVGWADFGAAAAAPAPPKPPRQQQQREVAPVQAAVPTAPAVASWDDFGAPAVPAAALGGGMFDPFGAAPESSAPAPRSAATVAPRRLAPPPGSGAAEVTRTRGSSHVAAEVMPVVTPNPTEYDPNDPFAGL